MTIQDEQFQNEKPHQIAMVVRDVMSGIVDLQKINPADLDQSDLSDLEMAYRALGNVLATTLRRAA